MRKKRLPFLVLGIAILLFFLIMACFPQAFTDCGRKESFGAWLPPSSEHILGTNSLGYDIFAEVVYGAKDTLTVALASGVISLIFGIIIGLLSAQKGVLGGLFSVLTNVFVMMPKLVVFIVVAAFVGSTTLNLIILISAFGWASTARAVRAKVIHIRSQEYIEICKTYGFSHVHTAVRHILPNLSDVILSRFLLGVNGCIMAESTLSFLGFGNLYYPTWGVMINFARAGGAIIRGAYQYLLAPCVCLMLLSLSFYFISLYFDGKRDSAQAY